MPSTGYKNRTTPGVYITELNAFPPSIVGVQTAVPAFIGYTEFAEINGKPSFYKSIKVGSMLDFATYFGGRYDAIYTIKEQTAPDDQKDNYDFSVKYAPVSPPSAIPPGSPIGGYFYYYLTDPALQFNLYDSMRLFYANGGGNCYIVSVGSYDLAVKENKISKDYLIKGLDVIKEQVGPTMLVIPDAVLLPGTTVTTTGAQSMALSVGPYAPPKTSNDFGDVVGAMLKQCIDLQDRVAILDVYSSESVDSAHKEAFDVVISEFHKYIKVDKPSYGMAYFPFLNTTVVQGSDFDYNNLASITLLQQILNMENENLYGKSSLSPDKSRYDQVAKDIKEMTLTTGTETRNQNLTAAIPLLTDIERLLVAKNSVLPPSAAMAGVYTYIDGTRGVWNAPANISLYSVDRTTYKMNDKEQGNLNMPIDGKAIDALREFVDRGTVVWGARTLDGNSNDWRYIQVRRTIIYIEQSIKAALNPFVFAANDANTWVTVTAMVSNFLENLWAQGGLMGAKSSDAYTVQCGLGSTMTGMDVLNGYMIVQITLQMIHPAEFIELTFKQKMEGVG
jgi:phage tail sheath protein FI